MSEDVLEQPQRLELGKITEKNVQNLCLVRGPLARSSSPILGTRIRFAVLPPEDSLVLVQPPQSTSMQQQIYRAMRRGASDREVYRDRDLRFVAKTITLSLPARSGRAPSPTKLSLHTPIIGTRPTTIFVDVDRSIPPSLHHRLMHIQFQRRTRTLVPAITQVWQYPPRRSQ